MIANIKKLVVVFVIMASALAITPVPQAHAGQQQQQNGASGCGGAAITFFPAWYDGLCDGSGNIKSPNSMGGNTGQSFGKWISIIALNIVAMLLYAVGYFSLGFIIFGGFKYMTEGDNASGVSSAKKTITNAVIGLIISIMAVAIVRFISGVITA